MIQLNERSEILLENILSRMTPEEVSVFSFEEACEVLFNTIMPPQVLSLRLAKAPNVVDPLYIDMLMDDADDVDIAGAILNRDNDDAKVLAAWISRFVCDRVPVCSGLSPAKESVNVIEESFLDCFEEGSSLIESVDEKDTNESAVQARVFGLIVGRYLNNRQRTDGVIFGNGKVSNRRLFLDCISQSSHIWLEEKVFFSNARTKKQIQILLNMGCVEKNPGPNPKVRGKKKGAKRKAPSSNKRNTPVGASSAGSIYYIPRQIAFPDALRTRLKYEIPLTLITGGGVLNSVRMQTNAYDVDPALGSTAMSGFAEIAVIYSRFRCLSIAYDYKICNLELFGQAVVHGFSTTSISSGSLGQNYAENSRFSDNFLGQNTSSRSCGRYRKKVSIQSLFGTTQALHDDLFTGSTTSSTLPSSATGYAYVGLIGTSAQVSGFQVSGCITLDLLFDRKNLVLG